MGATLFSKEEAKLYEQNGLDMLGMPYGLTSTRNGNKYWLTNWGPEWFGGCCHEGASHGRYFVCTKKASKLINLNVMDFC